MTATHTIKSTSTNFFAISDDGSTLDITATRPAEGWDPGAQVKVPLNDGQRIALAFAAIGGGSVNLSDQAARITDLIGETAEDLTDEDLIVVARRALRALTNRRKKRLNLDRHSKALLMAARRAGVDMGPVSAERLAAAGLRVADIK